MLKIRHLILSMMILLMLPMTKPSYAVEGGFGAYPNGFTGFYAGILPEPGTYIADYTYYYNGSNPNNILIPLVGGLQIELNTTIWANFIMAEHVTGIKLFGGNYGFALLAPINKVETSVKGPRGRTIGSNKTGLGDIEVIPYVLGWHWNDYHLLTAMTVYVPTGSYDRTRLANTSFNHVVVQPNLGFTWLNPNTGHEVSANLIYNYNFRNNATNYKSGQELHMDFTLAQHFPQGLGLGLGGYAYQQITNDSGAPAFLGGFKGRVFALGPQMIYSTEIKGQPFNIQMKYLKEFKANNHLQGNAFWFEFDVKIV